ncbi:MAG TPA: circadian clock KaiB family protein [Lacunisphaera sp.]|jgi:circadian clock protein KaiB
MTATGKIRHSPAGRSNAIVKATSRAFEGRLGNPVHEKYVLRLYITGTTPRSCHAIANIRSMCEEFLSGRYELDVIDIYQQPEEASEQQIIAAPTLIKQFPHPIRRIVGDLSDRDRVLSVLDLNLKPINPVHA